MSGGGDNEVPETEQEKALAKLAAAQYADYQKTGVPLEDAMIARANQTQADYDRVGGQTSADIQKQGTALEDQRIASMEESGVNANSGAAIMRTAKDANTVNTAQAIGGVKAAQAVTDRGLALKEQMVQIGRGQAADTLNSMKEQAASAANDAVLSQEIESQERRDTGASIGTMTGIVAGDLTKTKKTTASK